MDSLKAKISEVIKKLYGVEAPVEFAPVPAEIEGDYSCNVAMRLAKAPAAKMFATSSQILVFLIFFLISLSKIVQFLAKCSLSHAKK